MPVNLAGLFSRAFVSALFALFSAAASAQGEVNIYTTASPS